MEVFHLEILGFPETETSEELLQAQPEACRAAPLGDAGASGLAWHVGL